MTNPQRKPVWGWLAYGVLGISMLVRSKQPIESTTGQVEPAVIGSSPQSPDQHEPADQSRAAEPGRGRQATSPWQIPWQGWKDIFWRVYAQMNDDRILAVAGGVVFYALLALFPALTAFASLYGLLADVSTIDQHLSLASGILPSGAVTIFHEQLVRLTASQTSALSFGFVFGLLFALWSANSGAKAVLDALNVAYGESEKRSFVRLTLISLLFTLGAFVALTLALGVVVVTPIVLNFIGLGALADALVRILRWPALLAFVVLGLAVLYRYGASRREARWAWLSVGSIAAAVGWLVASVLFSWYLGALLLVYCELRQLQRDLWLAGRGYRHDDVDVDLDDRDFAWRRAQRRD